MTEEATRASVASVRKLINLFKRPPAPKPSHAALTPSSPAEQLPTAGLITVELEFAAGEAPVGRLFEIVAD